MNDDTEYLFPAFLLGLVLVAMVALGVWINTQTDAWGATFALLGL